MLYSMDDIIKKLFVKELVGAAAWILILVVMMLAVGHFSKPKILVLQDHKASDSVTIVRWIEDGKVQDCPVFCEEEVERVHAYLKKRAR